MKKLLLICILVIGCAGTNAQLFTQVSGGEVKVTAVDSQNYDYRVDIVNRWYPDWDADKQEDRAKTVDMLFKNQCDRAVIVKESMISVGKYLTGNPVRKYFVYVKCEAAWE